MTGHAIEAILLADKSGTPKFYMQLDPLAFDMNPVLAASFFAAIDMFSKEVFRQDQRVFQVNYGDRLFTVFNGGSVNLIAVGTQHLGEDTVRVLDSLLTEFETEWLDVIDPYDYDKSFVEAYLESFGESVMSRLSLRILPDSWVPYFCVKPESVEITDSAIAEYVNGSRSVKEIRELSGLSEREIILEMSKMWAHRLIRFRNMLDFNDFMSGRTRFLRYTQATSSETKDLRNLHPEMVGVIPRLAGLIDGRQTVREILAELGAQHDERELLRVMDYLLEEEVIEALSSEKRRILLAKEALEIALRVAEQIYGEKETARALRTAMSGTDTPETLGQLRLKDDKWSVDFDFKLLEGLDHRRLMLLYSEWMRILAQFTAALNQDRFDTYINSLGRAYYHGIIDRYNAYDLRGFEEFSFWLELLSNKKWPQVDSIRTGSLDQKDPSPVEEMAYTLVTRGQVIHGPEAIASICNASGVPLMNDSPDEWVGMHKSDALEKLMIEYSMLSPAARMTLMVLSRQRGIAIPNEVISGMQ
ncbi:MAG: hypothetical protein AM324_005910 [Candidatus Thorarchaeota archaeon SMTZ1-83]|nr:MAG: hypothetical protein AM324_07055 [Candidatus Thorarchaeota archaeon SMTZ1-83]